MSEKAGVRSAAPERCDRLRARLAALGADAALVTDPTAVRYLSGAPAAPGAALLLTGDDSAATVLDSLPRAAGQLPDGAAVVAVEEHVLTVERHRALAAALPGRRLVDLDRAVEQLRLVKDDGELAALRTAAEIADSALGELLESIIVGRTERHLALELERRMIDHGAEATAFPVSVGTGPNSGLPRHRPGERRVAEGDFLTVALGAVHAGYRSSTARTFAVGAVPAPWQIELHGRVFAAQRAVREALRPGAAVTEVAAAAGAFPEGPEGYERDGAETLGGGIGLQMGEEPRIDPASMGKLDARVPVTVGLGARLPGRGGVRLEDTLVVRPEADGGPELLTITTKELLAL
ncbi:peptidase M24 family protein [Mangrovactinospora gilvigrisea]|uniref:Peptidase M24 family protein n=1 Tax=Mangrovactinospora gilvigrisea TaxID=1428644 RepID=A0A1J7CC25_9ACTN|nr:M24 family metallopeptidase [Mangrovactinospora gilvigrisea]OIV39060.1 peptidase M24 family protein [Mangrovactinospora gilvigrisea]